MSFNPRIKAGERRYPTAPNSAQAAVASAVIATAPGTVYGIWAYNGNVAAQWIQIHDAAALPADAVNCLIQQKPAAAGWTFFDFGEGGMRFFNGLVVCNSSTSVAKTIGAADCQFLADYSLKA